VRVVVINSRVGNLGAIPNMLARLGASALVTDDPHDVEHADRIILPGVGSFDAALRNLTVAGLLEAMAEPVLVRQVPFLGVCLGMELLADHSEEGKMPGLGWIRGEVARFRFDDLADHPRVPHMGWNTVRATRDTPLLRDLGDRSRFYFAHSYYFRPKDPGDVIGLTDYGFPFASAVQRGNIAGVQFHPEKSHRHGLRLFENFLHD
jgi:imidazole glycerol-phosphate synthase subunit HisH